MIFYPDILDTKDLLQSLYDAAHSRQKTLVEDRNPFYWSKEWRSLSKEILKRDRECLVCRSKGLVTLDGLMVHHIYPLEYYPKHKLSKNNLIVVCQSCHNKIHSNFNPEWDDEWW